MRRNTPFNEGIWRNVSGSAEFHRAALHAATCPGPADALDKAKQMGMPTSTPFAKQLTRLAVGSRRGGSSEWHKC
jgi:hypothetical protein